jgi:hypothetical protein
MTRSVQRKRRSWLREAAKAICQAATNDCVMHGDQDRPPCDDRNCLIYPIARAAVKQARKIDRGER